MEENIKLIQEKLKRLTEQHEKELKENRGIFFSQYTKGQIDAFKEILSFLKY